MFKFDKGYWLIRAIQLAFISTLYILQFRDGKLEVMTSGLFAVLMIILIVCTFAFSFQFGEDTAREIGYRPYDPKIGINTLPIEYKKNALRCVMYAGTMYSWLIIPPVAMSDDEFVSNVMPLAILITSLWSSYHSFRIGFRFGESRVANGYAFGELRKLQEK